MCIKGRARPWAVEFADFQPALVDFYTIFFVGNIIIHENMLVKCGKKECESRKKDRILSFYHSHIAGCPFAFFYYFITFFFYPIQKVL